MDLFNIHSVRDQVALFAELDEGVQVDAGKCALACQTDESFFDLFEVFSQALLAPFEILEIWNHMSQFHIFQVVFELVTESSFCILPPRGEDRGAFFEPGDMFQFQALDC